MHESLISWLHRSTRIMAGTAAVTTLTFLTLVISPTLVAARQAWDEGSPKSAQTRGPSVEAQFAKTVIQLKRRLERTAERLERDEGPPDWVVFKQLRRDLEQLHGKMEKRFERLEDHIERKGLPTVILTRHLDAVDRYESHFKELSDELSAVRSAEDEESLEDAIQAAIAHLDSVQLESSHQPFDPSNLPFGTPEHRAGPPVGTGKALAARLKGKNDNSKQQTVELAGKSVPTNLDLAVTEDVQMTEAIESKAADLGHEPVAIYNWVRNNIEFIPSYGSIQGAHQTLKLKRGNAFDTASLLIALLRASDIPARYAYGTVTAPADQVMNWVGGVDVPEAAMNFMGQGGIPNEGVKKDGMIADIRFEHVWVEAWVDFEPSRGAIHVEGDTWVSLDASFKQYDYQAGMDIAEVVPFDAQGFADQLQSAATVNEEEGWVQGVDQDLIEDELNSYQTRVEDYINNQDPDATVGEVLGSRTIVEQTLPGLPSSLPYYLEARTEAFAELPDRLRWQFRYQLQDRFGSVVFTVTNSLPALAGRKLALSFKPATEEDQEVIESYLPEPEADGSIDPEDLPESLPGYLIHVVPEWTVDGEVVATGGEFALGEELRRETALKPPAQAWQSRTKYLVAGEYQAIGLDGQGLPSAQLGELQAELERVKSQLEAKDFAGLTKHDLTGNLLQTGIWSWFALNDVQNQIAARAVGVVTERLPSFGAFQLDLETTYSFGMPKEVRFPGLLMDISNSRLQIAAKNYGKKQFIDFNRAAGVRGSVNEHALPERLFSTPNSSAQGVSAVKALAIAAREGQRIYTITQDNMESALDSLSLDQDTESDIRRSVNAGFEVTAHQYKITHAGFKGSGYIVSDLGTGSGAYKISGGSDGAEIVVEVLGTIGKAVGILLLVELAKIAVAAAIAALLYVLVYFFTTVLFVIASITVIFNLINDVKGVMKDCQGLERLVALLLLLVPLLAVPIRLIETVISAIVALTVPKPNEYC